ncbi:hypothetical protein Vretifemale_17323, partial [Volvox reticuliferus]
MPLYGVLHRSDEPNRTGVCQEHRSTPFCWTGATSGSCQHQNDNFRHASSTLFASLREHNMDHTSAASRPRCDAKGPNVKECSFQTRQPHHAGTLGSDRMLCCYRATLPDFPAGEPSTMPQNEHAVQRSAASSSRRHGGRHTPVGEHSINNSSGSGESGSGRNCNRSTPEAPEAKDQISPCELHARRVACLGQENALLAVCSCGTDSNRSNGGCSANGLDTRLAAVTTAATPVYGSHATAPPERCDLQASLLQQKKKPTEEE